MIYSSKKVFLNECSNIANYFRQGQVGFSNQMLDRAILELSAIVEENPRIAPKLNPYLKQMLEAQRNRNYHYVADLIEYEIAPRVELVL